MREEVELSRDATAILIPSGDPVTLPKGTHATITQSLGGAYTVITSRGMMVRLAGKEVEAIGKEPPQETRIEGEITSENLEQLVWEQLKTCYDPEIPVNIVDLGLVYLCEVNPVEGEPGSFDIDIKMTLTAPGCGMGPVLANDARQKLLALPGVRDARVDVVFDPAWDRSMMSEAAKLQLGMMW
ncbi:MAG TPA: putative Fe-S cluster assembly protein SufT [Thermoanaerobaculia bacterium]|nr:putative Fe-S cluster assembly protein SufT [Thermoanaerobaculia bacterium]